MDLHKKLTVSSSPDFQHSTIKDISKRTLRVVGNSFTKSRVIITSPKEPAFAAGEGDKVAELP